MPAVHRDCAMWTSERCYHKFLTELLRSGVFAEPPKITEPFIEPFVALRLTGFHLHVEPCTYFDDNLFPFVISEKDEYPDKLTRMWIGHRIPQIFFVCRTIVDHIRFDHDTRACWLCLQASPCLYTYGWAMSRVVINSIMLFALWRRPTYIETSPGPITLTSCCLYAEKAKGSRQLIPKQLSFDQVLNGTTLPPASLNDFMDYLLYVSRSAENLQFLLWLKDYTKRFNDLSQSETSLSPEWNATRKDEKHVHGHQAQSQSPSDLEVIPRQLSLNHSEIDGTVSEEQDQTQPFRTEVNRIIRHYLIAGAPRELNLSYRTRNDVLQGVRTTTHPSVFKPCQDLVEQYLRYQSHPNFIRWVITNGRRPRTVMLRHLCTITVLVFVVAEIFLILSGQSRWFRIAMSPLLLAVMIQLQCMLQGVCVLLFFFSQREMRPWEVFANDEEIQSSKTLVYSQSIQSDPSIRLQKSFSSNLTDQDTDRSNLSISSTYPASQFLSRINPFGPRNSFEHEPWNIKWKKTPWHKKWTMTFSCTKIAQTDPGVKECQGRIMRQTLLIGLLATVLVTAGLVTIPEINLF